eukprot:GHVU01019495.1.p1 GENE.GHVU01019495.1~~GHVU01019495.1.p1  ORF type:complete len:684 (+),score=52.44 GHVU01019495.1:1607-3658(+)
MLLKEIIVRSVWMITVSIGEKSQKKTQTSFVSKVITSLKELASICKNYSHSGQVWAKGTRNKKNFLHADMLMIDVDEGCSVERFKSIFKKELYLLVTSKSHQKDKKGKICDRFHVYFPLASRCSCGAWYEKAARAFCEKYQFVDSHASIDTARFYYPSFKAKFSVNKGKKISLLDYAKPALTDELQFETADENFVSIRDVKADEIQVKCPWHGDSTPSARLYPNEDGRVSFHCFTCGMTIFEQKEIDMEGFAPEVDPDGDEDDKVGMLLRFLEDNQVSLFMDKATSEFNIYEDRVPKVVSKGSFIGVVQSLYFNLTGKQLKLSQAGRSSMLTCLPRYYKTFNPQNSDRVIGDTFNIYEERGITQNENPVTEEDISHTLYLLEGILPDEKLRRHFLNYLACFYQTKIPSDCAWIFKGTQGTGKNVMYDHIIKPIFGMEWCGQAAVLSSSVTFNSMVANRRWVLFNEVFGGSSNKYSNKTLLANTAKMYIGREAEFIINEKHKAERLYHNQANYLFFSNEFSPMMIEKSNRRFIVAETGQPLRDRVDDMEFFIECVDKEADKFAKFLGEYPADVKKYHQKIMTEAEEILIEDTMGRYQTFLTNMFEPSWLLERIDDRYIGQDVISYLDRQYIDIPTAMAYNLFTSIFGDEVTTKHSFLTKMRSMGAKMKSVKSGKGRMTQYFTKE